MLKSLEARINAFPIPLYKLIVVKEDHSPLYGASTVTNSSQTHDLLRKYFSGAAQEEFVAVFLDAKHTPVGYQLISRGSLTMSIVHPRESFKMACMMNAAAVIFAHNHPSGDPTPSIEDRTLTKRLVEAGEILGIRVLDHLVIGDGRFVSFADQGWLTT
jgi:DNA repair protein RadC